MQMSSLFEFAALFVILIDEQIVYGKNLYWKGLKEYCNNKWLYHVFYNSGKKSGTFVQKKWLN